MVQKLRILLAATSALLLMAFAGPSMASATPDGFTCEVNVAGCNGGASVYTGVLQANLSSPAAVLDFGFLGDVTCDTSSAEGEVTDGGPGPGGPLGYLSAVSFTDTRTTTGHCPSTFGTLGNPDFEIDPVDTNGAGVPGFWDVEGQASDSELVIQDVEVQLTMRDSDSGNVIDTCTYEGDADGDGDGIADDVVGTVNNINQTVEFVEDPLVRTDGPCFGNLEFSATYDLNGEDAAGSDIPVYLVAE